MINPPSPLSLTALAHNLSWRNHGQHRRRDCASRQLTGRLPPPPPRGVPRALDVESVVALPTCLLIGPKVLALVGLPAHRRLDVVADKLASVYATLPTEGAAGRGTAAACVTCLRCSPPCLTRWPRLPVS